MACEGYRYSSVTCPNRRSRCLSLNLPISKSVVRLNATEPAWPNTFQSPCARCIAAAGLGQSMGSPAAMPPPSAKSKGSATKRVIAAIRSHFVSLPSRTPGGIVLTGEKHQGSLSIATSGTFLARPSEENGLVCRVVAAKSLRSRPRANVTATVVTGRREWTCRSLSSQRCCWN